MTGGSAKTIAACFALSAFAVAILAGLSANLEASQIMWRAFIVMVVCYPVGLIVGVICQRVVRAPDAAPLEKAKPPGSDSEREVEKPMVV